MTSIHLTSSLLFFLLDQPIVASFPHFTSRPGKFLEKLEGIHPDPEKHSSYIIADPILGIPLNQRAVSQSNVVTKDLSGFKADISKFSNMVLPMFWCEYVNKIAVFQVFKRTKWNSLSYFQYLKEVTPVIIDTVDFIVNTLPKIQYWISSGFIVFGVLLLAMANRLKQKRKAKEIGNWLK